MILFKFSMNWTRNTACYVTFSMFYSALTVARFYTQNITMCAHHGTVYFFDKPLKCFLPFLSPNVMYQFFRQLKLDFQIFGLTHTVY